jgi:RNA recognition motif-containing protein
MTKIIFKASTHQKNLDIGANLFIGNLDPEVDEKLLYDTFSAFGVILQVPKVRGSLFSLNLFLLKLDFFTRL